MEVFVEAPDKLRYLCNSFKATKLFDNFLALLASMLVLLEFFEDLQSSVNISTFLIESIPRSASRSTSRSSIS